MTHTSEHASSPEGLSPEAISALVDGHARFLGFVERRVGQRDRAEEILQQAFVRAIERGHTLREGESATAWFYRLLRNALVDHYRRQGAESRAREALFRQLVLSCGTCTTRGCLDCRCNAKTGVSCAGTS